MYALSNTRDYHNSRDKALPCLITWDYRRITVGLDKALPCFHTSLYLFLFRKKTPFSKRFALGMVLFYMINQIVKPNKTPSRGATTLSLNGPNELVPLLLRTAPPQKSSILKCLPK